jgi:hypothetical protein
VFPIKYLGLPLLVSKPPKSALLTLVDQMADRLPTWKGVNASKWVTITDQVHSCYNTNLHCYELGVASLAA